MNSISLNTAKMNAPAAVKNSERTIPNPHAGEPYQKDFITLSPAAQNRTFPGYADDFQMSAPQAKHTTPAVEQSKSTPPAAAAKVSVPSEPKENSGRPANTETKMMPNPFAGNPHQPALIPVPESKPEPIFRGYA